MKLIVFLGNPGNKYQYTRHNAGFLFADFWREKNNFPLWQENKKFQGLLSESKWQKEKLLLIKPQTFMNLSGQCVKKVINFFQLKIEDIIIIYDDKDLLFGKIRFRSKGSSGGHRGMQSIINHLKTKEINRLKIGIENRNKDALIKTEDFVLAKFSAEELKKLKSEIFLHAEKLLLENFLDFIN